MSNLTNALVLNKFLLHLFCVTKLEELAEGLKDSSLEGYDENNVSLFYHHLSSRVFSNPYLSKDTLFQYDQNIYSHTKFISEKRSESIRWKYFQYLSLLFTEIYLDRYFSNQDGLQEELNYFLQTEFLKDEKSYKLLTPIQVTDTRNDLNKLAYWNATGSGKTLLMHVNVLQYKHYLKKHNRENALNRIIVLTPNEGLSNQHLKEFALSGIAAELFEKDKNDSDSLFSGKMIEIIDIHKLKDTSGDKTVAVESFESNNLVLVDEGHRGTGGEDWKGKRDFLCGKGFSFEYSATFGQAVNALSAAKQKVLLDEYGKAILFDYSYRYFYNDGYGKDYEILNIDEDWNDTYVKLYLTACLLSFYEQLLNYKEHKTEVASFLIEKPLAIFVGGRVTAVRSENKKDVSDVVEILKFLEGFVRKSDASIQNINRILQSKDGLNANGHPIFKNSFRTIKDKNLSPKAVYDSILEEVFNSKVSGALLHLDNLKGQSGEIGLRIGGGDYFGVVNVGDDSKLLKLCAEEKIATDEKDFSDSLFHSINSKDSKISILIGSKKFSEGWSSWRVSTMGLMNIGKGEGSEIIQLFGRGVRLKGYKFSLQRSSELDKNMKPSSIPNYLPILETLKIFGLKADYMQKFEEFLEEEGLSKNSDKEEHKIDIYPREEILKSKNLKFIQTKGNLNFKKSTLVDMRLMEVTAKVILDWYPKVKILKSAKNSSITTETIVQEGILKPTHLSFLNWNQIYWELEKFKNERSWYNLNLSRENLWNILQEGQWYTLYIPQEELVLNAPEKISIWQEIAVSLLKSYSERVYNFEKNKFYSENLELATLDSKHPNFERLYHVYVDKNEQDLIDKINSLKEKLKDKTFQTTFSLSPNFEAIYSEEHLYYPLLYIHKENIGDAVEIKPTSLNLGEKRLVEDIQIFSGNNPSFFENKEMFLLRNLSRKGIGFFEANNFYPDFILWILFEDKQYISFIDPKGLRQIQGLSDPKIGLHKTIKDITQLKFRDANIVLNSFIVSNTPYSQINHWRGQKSISDFNQHHVFFQEDQKDNYIEHIIKLILSNL